MELLFPLSVEVSTLGFVIPGGNEEDILRGLLISLISRGSFFLVCGGRDHGRDRDHVDDRDLLCLCSNILLTWFHYRLDWQNSAKFCNFLSANWLRRIFFPAAAKRPGRGVTDGFDGDIGQLPRRCPAHLPQQKLYPTRSPDQRNPGG